MILEREGTRVKLQRVTIEEHQVRDLVSVLLRLFIHIAGGHIDLLIVQFMMNPSIIGRS
jgi:hypothetical protein